MLADWRSCPAEINEVDKCGKFGSIGTGSVGSRLSWDADNRTVATLEPQPPHARSSHVDPAFGRPPSRLGIETGKARRTAIAQTASPRDHKGEDRTSTPGS